jgi:hypothetical protein
MRAHILAVKDAYRSFAGHGPAAAPVRRELPLELAPDH